MTPPTVRAQEIAGGERVPLVWLSFAREIGAEALLACYGWKEPPTRLRSGETAWRYSTDGTDLVGWGSLIKDPTTPTYWHTSGVFPAFARQGYRQAIRQHLCAEAFARGAEAVSLVVLGTNEAHLKRCWREAEAGSPWKPSGFIYRPRPTQTIFTLLREDWQAGLGQFAAAAVAVSAGQVCCCFHLHMPDSEPACGQSG